MKYIVYELESRGHNAKRDYYAFFLFLSWSFFSKSLGSRWVLRGFHSSGYGHDIMVSTRPFDECFPHILFDMFTTQMRVLVREMGLGHDEKKKFFHICFFGVSVICTEIAVYD